MSSLEVDPVAIAVAEAFGTPIISRVFRGLIRSGSWAYSDAIDGNCHVNANPFDYDSPGGEFDTVILQNNMLRDAAFGDLTIDQGCQLNAVHSVANNVRTIICAGKLTNKGIISADARAGAADAGGAQLTGTLTSGAPGSSGTTGAGLNGAAGLYGGDSGQAGAGSAGAGGAGGNVGAGLAAGGSLMHIVANNTAFRYGGSGGGAGGGDGANKGGGGGGGGPLLLIIAADFDNSAGVIRCRGGAGGNAAAGNCGGGGGGGGGAIAIITQTRSIPSPYVSSVPIPADSRLGTLTVTGGAKGLKAGTGTDGFSGNDGCVYLYYTPAG